MASIGNWVAGARPRTLPNAIAPVIVGSAAAAAINGFCWWRALLALLVAVAFVVGVNYANDYSDGIRGTDDVRVGPLRLVGSGLATPKSVKLAAFISLGIGAVAGLALSLASQPWLIAVGAFCIGGAWFYTGGRNPYGYIGLGEIAVFTFFGPVAVLGTEYTLAGRIDVVGVIGSIAVGCFSAAVLVANNLRDIPTDTESGKKTLAVRIGDARTRQLHLALIIAPFVATLALSLSNLWALVALAAVPLAAKANAPVRAGGQGPALIAALKDTGIAMLAWAILTGAALALG